MKKALSPSPRILSLILTLFLIFSALALPVFATQPLPAPREWEISDDMNELYDGTSVYQRINLPVSYYTDMLVEYHYSNELVLPNGNTAYLYSPSKTSGLVIVEDFISIYVYANAEAKAEIENFLAGSASGYRLEKTTKHNYYEECFFSDFDEETVLSLDALRDNEVKLDVTKLSAEQLYHIVAYDSTNSIASVHSSIISFEENFYYINYSLLSNSAFDADGNLSFRSGEIPAFAISGETMASFSKAIKSLSQKTVIRNYESSEEDIGGSGSVSTGSTVLFWISFTISGIALPIVPIVCGIKFANPKKHAGRKEWYILSGIGAAWLLLSISFILIATL